MQTQQITYDTRYAEQLIKSFNALSKSSDIQAAIDDMLSWSEAFLMKLFYFKEDDCLTTSENTVYSLTPSEHFKTLYGYVAHGDYYNVNKFLDDMLDQISELREVKELID